MLDYKDIIVKHFRLGMSGFPSAGGNHQLRDRRKDLRRQLRRGWP